MLLSFSSADAEKPETIKVPSNAHNVTNRRVFIIASTSHTLLNHYTTAGSYIELDPRQPSTFAIRSQSGFRGFNIRRSVGY
jgi:hypothetical protein